MSHPEAPSPPLEWEVIWMTGLALGGIAYGSLITIGVQCLMAFHPSERKTPGEQGEKHFNLHRVLQIHVTLILVLNTVLKIWQITQTIREIVFTDPIHFTLFERDWANGILVFLIIALTDGLLVWRCYVVQRALFKNSPAGFHDLCWILPLVAYLSSFPVGAAAFAFLDPHTPIKPSNPPVIFDKSAAFCLVAAALNIFINTFITCNIITRLLLHRRTVIVAFGKSCALAQYPLRISGILLESAAINVPLTVVMLLGTALGGNYVLLLMDIVILGQSIASILLTYQVVRGRAICMDSKEPGSPEALGAVRARNA